MVFRSRRWIAAFIVLIGLAAPAVAQKPGGVLQMLDFASPASMSIHEEATIVAGIPMMGVFNNLVVFDQHVAQNSMRTIVPDLATEWRGARTARADLSSCASGVKWHDGKPFTAADVKCTWDRLRGSRSGQIPAQLREGLVLQYRT